MNTNVYPNLGHTATTDDDDDDDHFEGDVWETWDDYGYADANLLGDDTWEDQKGMEELKRTLAIPDSWYLVKCINFDTRKLREIEEWLSENCTSEYRRVGWSSGCSTKVGCAFSNSTDALFFKLRWR